MRNRLRLTSGLILFVFVLGHFINHALGILSLEAMEAARELFIDPWRTMPGTVVLIAAFIVHTAVALWALWDRREMKRPAWEWAQLVLGLTAPLFLTAHVLATRGLTETTYFESSYATVMIALWVGSPLRGFLQAVALVIVWAHSMIGLHTWLRIKPGYDSFQPYGFAFAVALPVLALAGYVAAGMEVLAKPQTPGWTAGAVEQAGFEDGMADWVYGGETRVQVFFVILVVAIVAARFAVGAYRRKYKTAALHYSPGDAMIELRPGATLLESIRASNIPHASVCGGRGRCSTCRVRINKGLEHMAPPDEMERKVLARVTSSPSVRLACQIRPNQHVDVTAMVRPDAGPSVARERPSVGQGQELDAVYLFVDLRGSTKLSEDRLPFDVVFVLNQFFAELSLALEETNGHYAQFNGDGLMAIYGMNSNPERAAADAVRGALAMLTRIEALSARLSDELAEPLRIGVGLHAGEAIVGSMGLPASPIVSALGDNVNIAARLESQTKELGAPLVVSSIVADRSGIDFSRFDRHTIQVKGRDRSVDVFAVDHPETLSEISVD